MMGALILWIRKMSVLIFVIDTLHVNVAAVFMFMLFNRYNRMMLSVGIMLVVIQRKM